VGPNPRAEMHRRNSIIFRCGYNSPDLIFVKEVPVREYDPSPRLTKHVKAAG
jgi:hypothetical protein